MSNWRILFLCEFAAVWLIVLQVLAVPFAVIASLLSGRPDTVWIIEIFFVWPAILYWCAGYVGRFELIAPEGTKGRESLVSYAAHAMGMLGVLLFLLVKLMVLSDATYKWHHLLVRGADAYLLLALVIILVAFLVIQNYSKRHPEPAAQ